MENFTCAACSETFGQEDEYFDDMQFSTIGGKPICYPCFEDDLQYPSTVVRVDNEDLQKMTIGDYFILSDYEFEIPDWFRPFIPNGWTGRAYQSTDGWRGYYDTFKTLEGATEIADGWFTGWIDESVSRKQTVADLLEGLENQTLVPPVPIYVLLEPTSNVFSTATTIFTATKDVETIKEWLQEIGFTTDNLKYALS